MDFADRVTDGWPGRVTLVGATLTVLGGFFWAKAMTSGPLTPFTMAAADRGEPLPSRYVAISDAHILTEGEMRFDTNGSLQHFYPVVAKDVFASPEARPIRVFVRLDGKDVTPPPSTIVGTVETRGLPGPFEARLHDNGLLAPDSFVVLQGRNPADQAATGAWMGAFGAVILAIGIAWVRRAAPIVRVVVDPAVAAVDSARGKERKKTDASGPP